MFLSIFDNLNKVLDTANLSIIYKIKRTHDEVEDMFKLNYKDIIVAIKNLYL